MKRILLPAVIACMGVMQGAHAATVVSGAITANTTWTLAQSPYQVSADVSVDGGATLTVEAGVVVGFDPATNLIVSNGALAVRGTAGQPVVFTSTADANANASSPGDWGQIRFLDGTNDAATLLEHAQVRYGQGIDVQAASPTFNYLQISNNLGSAISIDLNSSPHGVGNQATGNTLNGISVPAGDVVGSVAWSVEGIPYVVASGTVSVGSPPVLNSLSVSEIQQGETISAILSGTRLTGAQSVGISSPGTTAIVQSGGTDTSVPIQLTAAPDAALGTADIQLLVDAGSAQLAGALQVIQPQPTVSGLNPPPRPATQATTPLTVSGKNFVPQSVVQLDGADLTTNYVSATTLDATLPALAPGNKSITVKQPDPLLAGSFLVSKPAVLIVSPPPQSVSVSPLPVAIPPSSVPYLITLKLATLDTVDQAFSVSVGDATVATVGAANVTIPAGQTTAQLQVTGLKEGVTSINLVSLTLGVTAIPVYVTSQYANINKAYSPLVGVVKQPPPVQFPVTSLSSPLVGVVLQKPVQVPVTSLSSPLVGVVIQKPVQVPVTSLSSPLVGVVMQKPVQVPVTSLSSPVVGLLYGATAFSLSPQGLLAGSSGTLTVTGTDLGMVTGAAVSPATGVTLGALQASPDGTQLTIPVSLAAGTAEGYYWLTLNRASGSVKFTSPGANGFWIAAAQPSLTSVTPNQGQQGTTLTGVTLQGTNLQNVTAVVAEPPDGITFSAPTVDATGTMLTVDVTVDAAAPATARVIRVSAHGVMSSAVADPGNTFTVVP